MTDTASLTIRADSNGLDLATKKLRDLTNEGTKAEGVTSKLTGSIAKVAGVVGGVVSVGAALNKLVSVTREFDVLNASLVTMTGSVENAAKAGEAIRDFATQTPYDLKQATEGFTKLVSLGLTPSERAMRSYGNTASAMGKDLNQMIEAVADAATGEFERLKEFGIKAKQQGDQVSLTFQGVTTTIANNASSIEEYLMKIGENQFAGSMANRMKTLDGALSNLSDQWDQLFLTVSQQGIGGVIEDGVRLATDALSELTDMIASGQAAGYLKAYGDAWAGTLEGVADSFTSLTELITGYYDQWGGNAEITGSRIADVFLTMPTNIKSAFQIITAEIDAAVDYAKLGAGLIMDYLNAALNPTSGVTVEQVTENAVLSAEKIEQAKSRAYAAITKENREAIGGMKEQIKAADELRKKYDEQAAARRASSEDRLAGFKINKPAGATDDSNGGGGRKKVDKDKQEFQRLVDSLRSEEQAISDSYDRRVELVRRNTQANSDQQNQLLDKVREARDKDMADLAEKQNAKLEQVRNSLLSEEEELTASYERKKQIVLDSTNITETERQDLLTKLSDKFENDKAKKQKAIDSEMLKNQSALFDGLAGIAKTFAGEQSGIYKAMFAMSKAFAVADAIVKIQQGIASAAAAPFPANLAAIGTVMSATAGIVSTISGTNMKGFKTGGYTGNLDPNSVAGVVHGNEFVFDSDSTNRIGKDNLENIRRGGGIGGTVYINITNNVEVGGSSGGVDDGMADRLTTIMNEVSQKTQHDILTSIEENGLWAKVMGGN